jgi:hypothetical protein
MAIEPAANRAQYNDNPLQTINLQARNHSSLTNNVSLLIFTAKPNLQTGHVLNSAFHCKLKWITSSKAKELVIIGAIFNDVSAIKPAIYSKCLALGKNYRTINSIRKRPYKRARIFLLKLLHIPSGSPDSVIAEQMAMVPAPAANTCSRFSSVIPPIAAWPTPVSSRIFAACFT